MPGKRDNIFGEERDSDNIVCPRCGQPGLYAVDGEAECVWCKQQFAYEGESERDRLIKETADAVARSAAEMDRLARGS